MNPLLTRKQCWWLVIAVAFIWFANLEYRTLIKPDEGRYAEIAREMASTGDWVTPRLNNLKYFEKPPLQYWVTATAYQLFGERQWTARLWTGLSGFMAILLVFYTARRLWNQDVALYAAAILSSSLLFVAMGHMNTLDMGVTFFMTAGLCGVLLAQHDGASERERRGWMLLAWAAMAGAVLSKGLIGIVLPGAVWVLYSLISRDATMWRRLNVWRGLGLFALLAMPWFVLVARANPEFLHFFFIHEHFERFLTKTHNRYEPWWWFIPVLLLGILPWLLLMLDTLWHAWKAERGTLARFKPQRYLLIWAVFIFVFFSKSDSKLASYILPIIPALAMLMGVRLTQISSRRAFWLLSPVVLLALSALLLSPYTARLAGADFEVLAFTRYGYWLGGTALLWLLAIVLSGYFLRRQNMRAAIVSMAFGGLLLGQGVISGHEMLAETSSARSLAQQIQPYNNPSLPFYSVTIYDHTLPFYLKRTFTLVAYQDEMEFGITQEPHKWIASLAEFTQVWRAQSAALAIMPPAMYEQLAAQNLPMQIIARDPQYTVVKKP